MPDHADAHLDPRDTATPSTGLPGRSAADGREPDDALLTPGQDGVVDRPNHHRRAGAPTRSAPDADTRPSVRPARPFVLDTRPDWMMAVRREDARHVRYGRPVSVLLFELTGELPGAVLDRVAGEVADIIRGEVRGTDRAVRLAARSFRILLPETHGPPARVAADRILRACQAAVGIGPDAGLRVEVASASRGRSLPDAIADAEERLGTADRPWMSATG